MMLRHKVGIAKFFVARENPTDGQLEKIGLSDYINSARVPIHARNLIYCNNWQRILQTREGILQGKKSKSTFWLWPL